MHRARAQAPKQEMCRLSGQELNILLLEWKFLPANPRHTCALILEISNFLTLKQACQHATHKTVSYRKAYRPGHMAAGGRHHTRLEDRIQAGEAHCTQDDPPAQGLPVVGMEGK
eukprot:1141311-Pelagomonas_calceolata.AAC.1